MAVDALLHRKISQCLVRTSMLHNRLLCSCSSGFFFNPHCICCRVIQDRPGLIVVVEVVVLMV